MRKKEARLPPRGNRALVVALRTGLAGPAVTNSALYSEAGGGRLRRPAGQTQVKPPRWQEHMSIKNHLLPTKGHGSADLESQNLDRSALPSSTIVLRKHEPVAYHYNRTSRPGYRNIAGILAYFQDR